MNDGRGSCRFVVGVNVGFDGDKGWFDLGRTLFRIVDLWLCLLENSLLHRQAAELFGEGLRGGEYKSNWKEGFARKNR